MEYWNIIQRNVENLPEILRNMTENTVVDDGKSTITLWYDNYTGEIYSTGAGAPMIGSVTSELIEINRNREFVFPSNDEINESEVPLRTVYKSLLIHKLKGINL